MILIANTLTMMLSTVLCIRAGYLYTKHADIRDKYDSRVHFSRQTASKTYDIIGIALIVLAVVVRVWKL